MEYSDRACFYMAWLNQREKDLHHSLAFGTTELGNCGVAYILGGVYQNYTPLIC